MYAVGSNPFTSHAKRVASADASKRVIGAAPLTPRSRASQDSLTVLPTGVIAPIPVTTTRRVPVARREGVGARSLMGGGSELGTTCPTRRAADRLNPRSTVRLETDAGLGVHGFGERCASGAVDSTGLRRSEQHQWSARGRSRARARAMRYAPSTDN